MSNQQAAVVNEGQRDNCRGRRRARHAVVAGAAVLLGIGGLAGCGDDDDASETVPGLTDEAVESSAPADDATTTTTTTASTTTRPTTTAAAAAATSEPVAAEATVPPAMEAATAATDVATTAGAEATAAADAALASTTAPTADAAPAGVDSSAPAGSEPTGTASASSEPITSVGPTTTGPECEYTENDEFPLERCDAGPAIAAVQSVLQAREYEIGTVDCLFGDQTHYAVRAFQTDEELTVTGAVDEETWAALDILDDWGTDTNGNGSIEPDEITLTCA